MPMCGPWCDVAGKRGSSSISGQAASALARIATTPWKKLIARLWSSSPAERKPMADSPGHQVAVYTGVFDPVHLGHLDVIRRGSRVFDRLVVGVGINPEKAPFFKLEERVQLVE